MQFDTESTVVNRAPAERKMPKAKKVRRMLWEVDPALPGLGEVPDGLEHSDKGGEEQGDKDEQEDDGEIRDEDFGGVSMM